MSLPNIGPDEITIPLLISAYRAAVGPADFAIHLAGRTGTYKTELTSLIQSHFGAGMDAHHLPASWSSTANALEALAYRAKDAIIIMDDFVPTGTSYQVRALQKTADQIIRAQGNQAGRSRLTDVSSLQTTYYPRGIIISTGEDVPDGHSVRGRMLILEIAPGDIKPKALSRAQAKRSLYPQAMADWVQWLATADRRQTLTDAANAMRDQLLEIGHARTPHVLGELIATAELMTEYNVEMKFQAKPEAAATLKRARTAILIAGTKQAQYLESADPVEALLETIRNALAGQLAHIKTRNGGVPDKPERSGWTVSKADGQMPTYKSNGPRIGWYDAAKGELLLDPGSIVWLKKYAGGRLGITQQTLLKRVKEASVLTRVDDTRQRNTVRVVVEEHPRQVLAIDAKHVFEL